MTKTFQINKKSFINLTIIIFLVIIIVLYGGATNNFDYETFKLSYNQVINTSFEPGYKLIESLFSNANINFDLFRLIIALFCVTLFVLRVNEFVDQKYRLYIYLIYLLTVVPFYSYSLRSAIGFSIITFAFKYLATKKDKDLIKFIILVFIAGMFHTSSLISMLFILIPILNKKGDLNRSVIYLFYGSLLMLLVISPIITKTILDFIFENILIPIGVSETKIVYTDISVRLGFILFSLCQIMFAIILSFVNKSISFDLFQHENYKLKSKLIIFAYDASLLLLMIIPILRITTEYSRFIRGFSSLYYIAVFSSLSILSKRNKMIVSILLILTVTINFITFVYPYLEETFYPLFKENWIINILLNIS